MWNFIEIGENSICNKEKLDQKGIQFSRMADKEIGKIEKYTFALYMVILVVFMMLYFCDPG